MDIEVTEQNAELLGNQDEEDQSDEEIPPLQEDAANSDLEGMNSGSEASTDMGSDEDAEISFYNRNSSQGSSSTSPHPSTSRGDALSKRKLVGGQDLDDEEVKSMEKFARFLERSGYITKSANPPTENTDENVRQSHNVDSPAAGKSRKNKGKESSSSVNKQIVVRIRDEGQSRNPIARSADLETTIYNTAVEMETDNPESSQVITK